MLEARSGDYVSSLIANQNLYSIRPRDRNLANLERIDRIIFVGSTCVGKSTLETAMRNVYHTDQLLSERVSVPQRVATRQPRKDDGDDIYFCSVEDFWRMVTANALGLYGIKRMENGREEPYGFLKPAEGTLPVFFANNQTLKNKTSVQPDSILENALIVLIYAPDSVREERLRQRSPQLFVEYLDEVAFRLSAEERAIKLVSETHLIVKNYGRYADRAAQDIVTLLGGIIIESRGGDFDAF